MDLLLDAVCVVDSAGRFVFVSAASERIFGYTPEEMIGRAMIDMVAPEDRERTLLAASEIMSGQPKTHFENRYVRKDGRIVDIMWSARWSQDHRLRIAVAHDISQRKRAESVQAALYAISEAAHSAENLPALFGRIHEIIGALLPAANFFVALRDVKTGELDVPYHADEQGQEPQPGRLDSDTRCAEVFRTGRTLLITPESEHRFPARATSTAGKDPLYWLGVPLGSGEGTIGVLVVHSYSRATRYSEQDQELLQFVSAQVAAAIERKQLHALLQHNAQYDALTDLPNRELLKDRLGTAITRARRDGEQLGLLYLDLDNFKQVNDTLGHAAGDLLLQAVASRLIRSVRESDTVARIGGDEFVVLLEGIRLPEHACMVAGKIRHALNQPLLLADSSVRILPSIGIALYPQHGEETRQLLQHADEAMYVAKKLGGNRVQLAATPAHEPD